MSTRETESAETESETKRRLKREAQGREAESFKGQSETKISAVTRALPATRYATKAPYWFPSDPPTIAPVTPRWGYGWDDVGPEKEAGEEEWRRLWRTGAGIRH